LDLKEVEPPEAKENARRLLRCQAPRIIASERISGGARMQFQGDGESWFGASREAAATESPAR
jgi:hypothetical protein